MERTEFDYIIIGSGVGGLLIGALLARDNNSVLVLEKLKFFGGKFTSINYKGAEVPTGAHHMLPHGINSPIYNIIEELGIDVKIRQCLPATFYRINGKDYFFPFKTRHYFKFIRQYPELTSLMPLGTKLKMLLPLFFYKLGFSPKKGVTVKDDLNKITKDPLFHKAIHKASQYAFGVGSDRLYSFDVLTILRKYNYQLQAVVVGGVKSIIDGLVKYINENRGKFVSENHVSEIIIEDGKASGVKTADSKIVSAKKGIISNTGIKGTYHLVNNKNLFSNSFVQKMQNATPSWGANHIAVLNKSVLGRQGVIVPLDCDYVAGITEPTLISPEMAKNGKSLILGYQVLNKEKPLDIQLKKGKKEFLRLCGDIDERDYLLSVFVEDMPTVEMSWTSLHSRINPSETGIYGLWMIGADNIGMGIAGDLIGDAVRILHNRIKKSQTSI